MNRNNFMPLGLQNYDLKCSRGCNLYKFYCTTSRYQEYYVSDDIEIFSCRYGVETFIADIDILLKFAKKGTEILLGINKVLDFLFTPNMKL